MPLRSRTGCATCKSRHQKCDETHPECKRCVRLGLHCHYPHLEDPDARVGNRPLRPASSRLVGDSANYSTYQSTSTGSPSNSPCSSESWSTPSITVDRFLGFSTGVPPEKHPNELPNISYFSQDHPSPPFDFSLPADGTWHVSLQPPTRSLDNAQAVLVGKPIRGHGYPGQPNHSQASQSNHPALSWNPNGLATSERYSPTWPTHNPSNSFTTSMTAGQASLFQALFSLAGPENETLGPPNPKSHPPAIPCVSPPHSDEASEDEDEEDPEGVGRVMCNVPQLDSNVESNTLAFVLQSYARWFTITVFDPLRLAHQAKKNVVAQFYGSASDRRRVILVANAFNALGKSLELNSGSLSYISSLRTGAHQGIIQFNATQPSFVRELDIQEALRTLENMIEILLVHFYSSPLPTILYLMREAAPVFRRACLEPIGQLPNLPNMLLEPGLHRRYFAVVDVSLSVTTARPMLFRYDVTSSPNLSNEELPLEYGLEWMHGIPDRCIVLFARINGLMEDCLAQGVAVDPERVTEIEQQIKSEEDVREFAKSDPVLRVGRIVVRECWQQAVSIYLYMALCGAHAKDPRVEKPFKKAMRLIESTRAGRNPDAFLFIPMIVTAVAACNQADRDMLNRRMLATRECSVEGIVGNDCVRALNDLWTRTDKQSRPARWADFRVSFERVVGM